ncbi:Uncharacterized conserved protein, DUF924 family [Polaromonas sp. OV174]|uniref:DUF924 family protein n=1 Tax=Polaromonas sp. OV174 TaxID=1855300 RepID=UPI0008E3D57F|nr:DUF924 family protein [Polaromonas sp. OV174]SFB73385.1 Uncharacterized conserved protein, DUF924 family [Polaromonas sp. OV174]
MTAPSDLPQQTSTQIAAAKILDFWLADGLSLDWPTQDLGQRWFGGGAALDQDISDRFGPQVAQAVAGGLQDWEAQALSRLALVILLDQFTRNVFRGTAKAFAGDARAQQLVLQTLARHEDLQLPWVGRVFMYMPLMHAEDPALQDECLTRFAQLQADAPAALKPRLQGNLDAARQHQAIIARFGRFPYRNAALGRTSTVEEQDFLRQGPRFGQ